MKAPSEKEKPQKKWKGVGHAKRGAYGKVGELQDDVDHRLMGKAISLPAQQDERQGRPQNEDGNPQEKAQRRKGPTPEGTRSSEDQSCE